MNHRPLLAALAFAATTAHASFAAAATNVAGVTFEDTASVAGQTLVLNGAGVRTRLLFKVYAMGLYVPQRANDAGTLQSQVGSKRIRIVTLRDLSAEQFLEALVEGLKKNHTAEALAALETALGAFRKGMLEIKDAPANTEVLIESWNGATRLTVAGKRRGEDIADERFFPALLRIWIGDVPADAELKQHLLGKPS